MYLLWHRVTLWGGGKTNMRRNSFSPPLLRGLIQEGNTFTFLAGDRPRHWAHASSLYLEMRCFPPSPTLCSGSRPSPPAGRDLDEVKTEPKSPTSLHKASAITCHRPTPPVSSLITALHAHYSSHVELLVGPQIGHALACASSSHPPNTGCPSDSAQILQEKICRAPAMTAVSTQQRAPRPFRPSGLHPAVYLLADLLLT